MGLLSLQLEQLIHANKKGIFRTYYLPTKSFYLFKKEMQNQFPLKISNGKIESGFLALNSTDETTMFGAYILV
jgi:hypothetical protein